MITLGPPGSYRIIFPSDILNLVTSVKSILPCKVTYLQVLGIRDLGIVGGGIV